MLNFSRNLRIFLAENNIKKKDFANDIDVSTNTISNWLHGNIQPNRHHAMAIDDYTNGVISMEIMGY